MKRRIVFYKITCNPLIVFVLNAYKKLNFYVRIFLDGKFIYSLQKKRLDMYGNVRRQVYRGNIPIHLQSGKCVCVCVCVRYAKTTTDSENTAYHGNIAVKASFRSDAMQNPQSYWR